MADWVQVAIEIAAAAVAFIAGYASLRADQGALKESHEGPGRPP
jgi:hypothetical protein